MKIRNSFKHQKEVVTRYFEMLRKRYPVNIVDSKMKKCEDIAGFIMVRELAKHRALVCGLGGRINEAIK
jgi:hypothetical protein